MAKLRIAMIAGESSGDILGSGLIKALKRHFPDAQFEGIGGDLMCAEGFKSYVPMETLSVMGLVEVLGRLPELLKLRKKLIQDFLKAPPDIFIGIDAPDFNLHIERSLKAADILTVHYVSPSVWAWKRKRIYTIKESVDLLLALFPFEPDCYQATGQRVVFVGHPLADTVLQEQSALTQVRLQGRTEGKYPVVALLPGSRSAEIKYLAKPFLEASRLLKKQYPDIEFILPAANQKRYDVLKKLIDQKYGDLDIRLTLKHSREALAIADVVLIASGTATLEATLLKKPMVVAYKMSPLTYAIYSRMLKTPYVSLPNILAGEALVPEILQGDVTATKLAQEVEHILEDKVYQQTLTLRFEDIFNEVCKNADECAATAVKALLDERVK
ncbi:lipid-A-disaccharide synthase [Neptunomonas concharum]|uniref:Lipid-A-disaccharide synthase n=1 Tax=Neptunomonas concharum TaxID=1031538 RepID=A0A5P1R8V1_9GAMM|nr:lipid-A-disaccharide synthase [Neptunomonas concharum]QEQ95726.1 lipid-A-disaccharide synthase [Neptunomonas concharum]